MQICALEWEIFTFFEYDWTDINFIQLRNFAEGVDKSGCTEDIKGTQVLRPSGVIMVAIYGKYGDAYIQVNILVVGPRELRRG